MPAVHVLTHACTTGMEGRSLLTCKFLLLRRGSLAWYPRLPCMLYNAKGKFRETRSFSCDTCHYHRPVEKEAAPRKEEVG